MVDSIAMMSRTKGLIKSYGSKRFSFGFNSAFPSRSFGNKWNKFTIAAISFTSLGDFLNCPGATGAFASNSSQYLMCSRSFSPKVGLNHSERSSSKYSSAPSKGIESLERCCKFIKIGLTDCFNVFLFMCGFTCTKPSLAMATIAAFRDVKLEKRTVEMRSRNARSDGVASVLDNSGVLNAVLSSCTHDCLNVERRSFSLVSTFMIDWSSLSAMDDASWITTK
mmetsp:Transcript_332/g.1382  ORF Transcript_332/g.1382 Transcript_332/m.1382 type:complete len:223 (+) Transcript_332:6752-7420(+)